MSGIDHGVRDTVGIVAHRYVAEAVMEYVIKNHASEVKEYLNSKYNLELLLNDGTRFILCPMSEASRGRRLTYAIVERNVDVEFLNNVVYPMCSYCKEDEILYIDDEKDAVVAACNIIGQIKLSRIK